MIVAVEEFDVVVGAGSLRSAASGAEQDVLLDAVDSVAEIPRSIRAGATVERYDLGPPAT